MVYFVDHIHYVDFPLTAAAFFWCLVAFAGVPKYCAIPSMSDKTLNCTKNDWHFEQTNVGREMLEMLRKHINTRVSQ